MVLRPLHEGDGAKLAAYFRGLSDTSRRRSSSPPPPTTSSPPPLLLLSSSSLPLPLLVLLLLNYFSLGSSHMSSRTPWPND